MARNSLAVCLMLLIAISMVYEVQGTFLLRHYLRKIPRRSREAEPFACKGMMIFMKLLERRCPLRSEYKGFFGRLRSYMNFINSNSGSNNFDVELKGQAQGLQSAISAMSGKSGSSADTSKVMDVLMSMGKTLGEQKRSGSTEMTFSQRSELIVSMVKWARVITQFVASTAIKNGDSVDVSSLGIDGIDDTNMGSSPTKATGTNGGTSITGSYKSSSDSTSGTQPSNNYGGTQTGSGNSFKGKYESSANYQQSNRGSSQQTSQQTSTGSNVEN